MLWSLNSDFRLSSISSQISRMEAETLMVRGSLDGHWPLVSDEVYHQVISNSFQLRVLLTHLMAH